MLGEQGVGTKKGFQGTAAQRGTAVGSCLTLPSSESTPKFCGPESVPLNPFPFQISKLERGSFLWRGTCPYSPFNFGVQRGSIPDLMYPHPYVNVKAITQMNAASPPPPPLPKQETNQQLTRALKQYHYRVSEPEFLSRLSCESHSATNPVPQTPFQIG